MRLHRLAWTNASDPGCAFKFYVDTLRAVLKEPLALWVCPIIAGDEGKELVVLEPISPALRKATGRLHGLVSQVPAAAGIQTQPAVAGGYLGPLHHGLKHDVIHDAILHGAQRLRGTNKCVYQAEAGHWIRLSVIVGIWC